MQLDVVRSETDVVVTIRGHLVVGTRHLLHEAIAPLVAQGVRHVILDFRDSAYIDSTGLATLAALARLLGAQGGRLQAVGMAEALRAACTLARLDGVLHHPASVEAARREDAGPDSDVAGSGPAA